MSFPLPTPQIEGFRLPGVPDNRPVRVELTGASIFVFASNGTKLVECPRTIEFGEAVADILSEQRLTYEAQALRDQMRGWRW